MKKDLRYILITVFFLNLLTSASIFAEDSDDASWKLWQYKAEVTVARAGQMYSTVELTPSLYDVCRADMADVRLVNSDGEVVPYILAKGSDTFKRERFGPKVINRSVDDDGAALVTLDFGRKTVKNMLEVETVGDNFRRHVMVEGSNDNVEFFNIAEKAYVFAIGNVSDPKVKNRFSEIELGENDYRYLRIRVWPMMTESKSPVIESVYSYMKLKPQSKKMDVATKTAGHSEDAKKNLSYYIYDLSYKNLPLSKASLSVSDESFYRYVTIEGRDSEKRKIRLDSEDNVERYEEIDADWKRVTSSAIYRYPSDKEGKVEKLEVKMPVSKGYRYLRFVISNYDDRPLDVMSVVVEMMPGRVLFEGKYGGEMFLYAGNEDAAKPRYDIVNRIKDPSKISGVSVQMGELLPNPTFGEGVEKAKPWTERHKGLLLVVLLIVVGVVGVFIYDSFRNIQRQQGG